jgi:hypothetical protein
MEMLASTESQRAGGMSGGLLGSSRTAGYLAYSGACHGRRPPGP